MDLQFRLAKDADSKLIWNLLKMAILRRKQDGSNQWQDGYPNMKVIYNVHSHTSKFKGRVNDI